MNDLNAQIRQDNNQNQQPPVEQRPQEAPQPPAANVDPPAVAVVAQEQQQPVQPVPDEPLPPMPQPIELINIEEDLINIAAALPQQLFSRQTRKALHRANTLKKFIKQGGDGYETLVALA